MGVYRTKAISTHELSTGQSNYEVYTNAIIEEAKSRGIPASFDKALDQIRLGYGKYQKCISPALISFISKTPSVILDKLFPQGEPFTIPIVSITGTNGKTTTTRMISQILIHHGYKVGTTTTHGIYINRKCIEQGDTTGPISARRILNHHKVEAAVLETARGGIVRGGLGYEKADVAVFTNLTEDHLGIDGINTLKELLKVKAQVIEAVKEGGVCVLNADDPWVMQVASKARGDKLLFSLSRSNPYISDSVKPGTKTIFLEDNSIFAAKNGRAMEIIKINDIPATLNGGLKYNVYNSMAAIGACLALGVRISAIRNAMRIFSCDDRTNPGRFNIYDMGEFKVILDYGHNHDGYRATIDGVKCLKPARTIGVIGVPGDRRNDDIKKIGKISGGFFDKVIIKEDRVLRGRKPCEVANILKDGVLEAGMEPSNVEIIPDEVKALQKALSYAKKDDVIIIFFEKMDPMVSLIRNYKIKLNKEKTKEYVPV